MFDTALLREIERLQGQRNPFCLATVVDGRGSIPQVVGARALFTAEGLVHGTIGGGRIETRCAATAAGLLAGDRAVRTRFERINLQKDAGMTCAGEMALYFEVYRPDIAWDIVVFGAGHVAQKLCRFLVELDCRVTCVDTRPEWLERLPAAANLEAVRVEHYSDGLDRIRAGSEVLIMTMGHTTDIPILADIAAAGLRPSYLGVIGSDSKAATLRRDLRALGLDQTFIDAIVCPLGDKLGNNTPGEIAVGIVAQLVRRRKALFAEES